MVKVEKKVVVKEAGVMEMVPMCKQFHKFLFVYPHTCQYLMTRFDCLKI